MWSEELIYRAFNWSVKKFLMKRDEDPPTPFLTSKMEEWLMMTFVLENCLLNLFVVLDLDLGSILIDNSFFFVSQKLEINIIYFICFWQQYEKCHSVYMCRFQWNYPILRHVR